jgi:hypothetical protein
MRISMLYMTDSRKCIDLHILTRIIEQLLQACVGRVVLLRCWVAVAAMRSAMGPQTSNGAHKLAINDRKYQRLARDDRTGMHRLALNDRKDHYMYTVAIQFMS